MDSGKLVRRAEAVALPLEALVPEQWRLSMTRTRILSG